MVYTRTLKPKFDIHPGRVRRPRRSNLRQRYLLSRRERPELVAINPETPSINTDNVVNSFSDSAGASVNSEDVVGASINNDDLEDDLRDSDDDLEQVSINNDNLEDVSSDEDGDPENDDVFSQNDDYSPSTQKMADGPEPFQPFDGEYGPYFANFTEQMLFLWVTKHMICK
jgi:hypothetical protein